MSLFGKFWNRFRNLRSRKARAADVRRRRLFAEPLEARQLLAITWNLQKTEVPDPNQSDEYGITATQAQRTPRLIVHLP